MRLSLELSRQVNIRTLFFFFFLSTMRTHNLTVKLARLAKMWLASAAIRKACSPLLDTVYRVHKTHTEQTEASSSASMLAFLRRYVTHPCSVYDAQLVTHAVFMLFGIASPLRTNASSASLATTSNVDHRRESTASTITCNSTYDYGANNTARSARSDHPNHTSELPHHSSASTERWFHTVVRLLVMLTQWCGCLVALWIALLRDENFISFFFESDVSKVTSLIELVLSMVAVTVVYGISFVRREHVQRLFALMHFIDGRLDRLMCSLSTGMIILGRTTDNKTTTLLRLYRRTVWFSIGCTAANLTVLALYIGYSYAMQWTSERSAHMYAWVAYFWPQIVLAMVVDQAMCLLWQLAQRFDQLNQVINNILIPYIWIGNKLSIICLCNFVTLFIMFLN